MENDNFGILIDSGGNFELSTNLEEDVEDNGDSLICVNNENDRIIKQVLKEFKEEKAKENALKPVKERQLTIFEKFYEDMGWHGPVSCEVDKKLSKKRKVKEVLEIRKDLVEDKEGLKEILKKSKILQPDFETLQTVPAYNVSQRQLKRQRAKERDKTKGKMWFNLPATEVTDEVKKDLEVLKMRSVLDPKHFYKKNDVNVLPKYFQIGTVQDTPLDYHERLTKKERKKTLVDELLADAEFGRYNKKKYAEIVAEKQKTHYSAYKQAKKLKRKKKK